MYLCVFYIREYLLHVLSCEFFHCFFSIIIIIIFFCFAKKNFKSWFLEQMLQKQTLLTVHRFLWVCHNHCLPQYNTNLICKFGEAIELNLHCLYEVR